MKKVEVLGKIDEGKGLAEGIQDLINADGALDVTAVIGKIAAGEAIDMSERFHEI